MKICKNCATIIKDSTITMKGNPYRGMKCPNCGTEMEYINELQAITMKWKLQNMKKSK